MDHIPFLRAMERSGSGGGVEAGKGGGSICESKGTLTTTGVGTGSSGGG